MISKNTNKDEVKFLATVMIFALTFAGIGLIASDVAANSADADTGETSEATAEVSLKGTDGSTKQYISLDMAIKEAKNGDIITLLKDVEVDIIHYSTNITIDGGDETLRKITLTGNGNQIWSDPVGSNNGILIKNVILDPIGKDDEGETVGVMFGHEAYPSKITLENVTIKGEVYVYGGVTFEADQCKFKNKVQLQFADKYGKIERESSFSFKDSQIGTLEVAYSGDRTVISGKEATISIDNSSVIGTLSVVNSEVELRDCSIHVDVLSKREECKGTFVLGKDVELTPSDGKAVSIAEGTTVVISKDAVFEVIKMILNGKLEMKQGATFVGTLQNSTRNEKATNTLSSSNGIIADSDLTFSKGSITMDGSIVPADEDGTITISGNAKVQGETTVKNLIVLDGAVLTVCQDATLKTTGNTTINGKLIIDEKGNMTNSSEMTINGEVKGADKMTNASGATVMVTPNAKVDKEIPGSTGGYADDDKKSLGLENYLENDLTISNKAFLADDLTVKKGVTLTIASKGDLNLNGHALILEGNLIVADGGSITAFFYKETGIDVIRIKETGSITNDGIIGKGDNEVTVISGQDATNGKVTLRNVVGVEFSLTKVVDKELTKTYYMLTVSGTVIKNGSDYALGIDGAYITDLEVKDLEKNVLISNSAVTKNGSVDIGSKAVVTVSGLTLQNGVTMTIDGKLVAKTGKTVSMWNGALVAINGNTEGVFFSAKTGEYETYTKDKRTDVEELADISSSTVALTNLNGLTIEVTSRSYTAGGNGNTPMMEQMFDLFGTASFAKDGKDRFDDGSITTTGKIYVPGNKELVLSEGMTFEGSGTFVTLGTIKAVGEEVESYIGSSYSVKSATDSSITSIYTTFDNAYAAIAGADDQKVTIMGGYTFTKEYTVAADQTIEFDGGEEYKISKDGKITVSNDGTLSEGFATSGIQGVLVVMDEGDCTPVSGSYEVRSVDVDGTTTYSGAAWAIENAKAGDTIDIVGTVKFPEKVTVPEGVTIDIKDGTNITANGGMSVNGKVLNGGEITVANGKSLEVSGTVDNTINDTCKITTTELTVTGTFIGTATAKKINAANYQNEDLENIYTSVAEAVKASSAMDIPADITVLGKFTEDADIILSEDMKLSIHGEITLKSIRLSTGSILKVESSETYKGILSADIIGAVGKADTTGVVSDATVNLKKVTVVEFTLTYDESTMTSTMTMSIGDYEGAVTFAQGETVLRKQSETTLTLTDEKTMTIDPGATATLSNEFKITDASKKAFTNNGTLKVNAATTFTGALGGEVFVKEGVTLDLETTNTVNIGNATETITEVIGTITLLEKGDSKASVRIVKEVHIGTAPTTLGASGSVSGKIEFSSGESGNSVESYVIVFEGSTFSATTKEMKSTSYSVNGIALGTIHTTQDISINKMDSIVRNLDDIVTSKTENDKETQLPIEWMNGTEPATGNVGSVGSVDTTLDYKSVDVKVSEGPGLQVYIDDVKADVSEKLTIGTHTITVYLKPNYEGTPVIKLNGVTIIDGTFEITTDMMGEDNKIVVTGATYVQPTTPVTPVQPVVTTDDDDMGLTEYLLIVLVILATILVVVVAIRMMRS